MDNVSFYSDYGKLFFAKIVNGEPGNFTHEEIATYYYPISLTDSDILGEKQQSIYSLVSILKGLKKEINKINDSDIMEKTADINDHYNSFFEEMEQRKQLLEEEKNKTIEYVKENLTDRKIKTLEYPKS